MRGEHENHEKGCPELAYDHIRTLPTGTNFTSTEVAEAIGESANKVTAAFDAFVKKEAIELVGKRYRRTTRGVRPVFVYRFVSDVDVKFNRRAERPSGVSRSGGHRMKFRAKYDQLPVVEGDPELRPKTRAEHVRKHRETHPRKEIGRRYRKPAEAPPEAEEPRRDFVHVSSPPPAERPVHELLLDLAVRVERESIGPSPSWVRVREWSTSDLERLRAEITAELLARNGLKTVA
jgi:hypothetical protein